MEHCVRCKARIYGNEQFCEACIHDLNSLDYCPICNYPFLPTDEAPKRIICLVCNLSAPRVPIAA